MKIIAIACLLVVSACGRDEGQIDELIGASCTRDDQCEDHCFRDSSDYPGGFCSIQCDSDTDCTSDSYCIAKDGGVCMFVCPDVDCGTLGAGWVCKEKDRVGGGKIPVCIGQ